MTKCLRLSDKFDTQEDISLKRYMFYRTDEILLIPKVSNENLTSLLLLQRLQRTKLIEDKRGYLMTAADKIATAKELNEKSIFLEVIELLIALLILLFLFLDYFFSGFHTGEPLFISDAWDMIITCFYLRSTLLFAFRITFDDLKIDMPSLVNYLGMDKPMLFIPAELSEEEVTKRLKLHGYFFISSYFFYNCAGKTTKAILSLNPTYLVSFWFDVPFLLKFFCIGFCTTYFFPNDFLYKMVYKNKSRLHEIIGDLAWAVSKLNSLKRSVIGFSAFSLSQSQPQPQARLLTFMLLFPVLIFSCQLNAALKPLEMNFIQNKQKIDFRRAKKEFGQMIKGQSMTASIYCSLFLNLRFMSSDPAIVFIFDILALSSIFYRYSHDILFKLNRNDILYYSKASSLIEDRVIEIYQNMNFANKDIKID